MKLLSKNSFRIWKLKSLVYEVYFLDTRSSTKVLGKRLRLHLQVMEKYLELTVMVKVSKINFSVWHSFTSLSWTYDILLYSGQIFLTWGNYVTGYIRALLSVNVQDGLWVYYKLFIEIDYIILIVV